MFAQEVIAQGVSDTEVQTTIHYVRENPYEVRFHFPQVTHEDTDWIFSRDLLVDALENGSAGEGDVRISVNGSVFSVTVGATFESGGMVLNYDTMDIRTIVNRSLDMVPLGSESIKFDNLLADEEIEGWVSYFGTR